MSELQSTSNNTLSNGSSSLHHLFLNFLIALIKNKWALISVFGLSLLYS